jgi:hypothetical protein
VRDRHPRQAWVSPWQMLPPPDAADLGRLKAGWLGSTSDLQRRARLCSESGALSSECALALADLNQRFQQDCIVSPGPGHPALYSLSRVPQCR